jgi:hypothetical protein
MKEAAIVLPKDPMSEALTVILTGTYLEYDWEILSDMPMVHTLGL